MRRPRAESLRPPRRGAGAPAALAVALLILAPVPARAVERVVRLFNEKDGLAVSEVQELAQDSRGFLWISTVGGLVRFDGREMRPWAPELIRHVVEVLSTDTLGHVLAGGRTEALYSITQDGAELVTGPHGGPILGWAHATMTPDGSIVVAMPDTLWRRDPAKHWSALPAAPLGGLPLFRVRAGPGDSMFVATQSALWLLARGGGRRLVAPIGRVNLISELPSGARVVLTRAGVLWELAGGTARELIHGSAHGRGLAVRGDVIWASIDQYLYAIRPGEPPEVVAPAPHTPTGRPILVDREGTLWVGAYIGLMGFPEPETVAWNAEDGLPRPTHARFVHKTDDVVWVSTWYGAGVIVGPPGGRHARTLFMHSGCFATDGFGATWTGALDSGFVERRGGRATFRPFPGLRGVYCSAQRPDGTLWLGTDEGLFLTPEHSGAPLRPRAGPPAGWGSHWDGIYIDSALEDASGELWVTNGESVAHAHAAAVADSDAAAWSSDTLPNVENVAGLERMPSGDLWAATGNGGLLRRRAGRWETLPGARALGSLRTYGLIPSPSGGVWVLASGSVVRVVERTDLADGWEVKERLSAWDGLPNQQASDLFEEPDGRLWLATLAGIVEIPPQARRAAKRPPPVALVDVRVDGQRMPIDRPLSLPYRRNRVELQFAALSFRDRNLLRYQVRLKPGAPWIESHQPSFLFANLAPGTYSAEMRASLDGLAWSQSSARITFAVMSPWYLEPWALVLFALVALALLYAAYRARVNELLRLERQRTRIAMDLHDEMGSGLGSIGILAGLAADDRVDDTGRRRLAAQIAEAANELGAALSDIVGSLRAGSDTLEAFALRLAERAGRLFPDDRPRLTTEYPESWPRVALPAELRRNLQLIAVEALHNVARHAGASRVTLGLTPDPNGRVWRLRVVDDGRGLGLDALAGRAEGNGLRNMRSRAEQIGATMVWTRPPGGGTAIEVAFTAQSGGVRNRDRARTSPLA